MSRTDKPPLGEPDARLLRALRAKYPHGHFDEFNIGIDGWLDRDLLDALAFLGPTIDRRRRALGRRSREAVERWIERVEGRPIDGLALRRSRIGWCYVERFVVGPTGPTGCGGSA
jgi:hypothetical protein